MSQTIGDIMERDAYTCRYDQDLGEVVALFNELGTSGLVVIDEDGRLIGMVRRATITRYLFDVLFGEEEPSAE